MSLLLAVQSGVVDDVKRLVDSKGNPNERDAQNQTPLHAAAQKGNKEIVVCLLQKCKKIDINAQDDQGWTPLLVAIVNDNYEICEILLGHKSIKASIPNFEFNSALIYLCKKRSVSETARYKTILTMVHKQGVDLNERNRFGETALHYAAMCNNHDAIDFLHENNANFNAINNRGESPLQYALSAPEYKIVSKLLKYGSDSNIKPHNGVELSMLTEDAQIKLLLEQSTSHNVVIKRNMIEFKSLNDLLVATLTELDSVRTQLQMKKTHARKSVDTQRTVQKFGTMTKTGRRAHKYFAVDLEIFEPMNRQLDYARSGDWACCVYRNECGDDSTTTRIYQNLSFLDEVQHPNILPVIQLRRYTNEVQMFVSCPSSTLNEYLSQERYVSQNGLLSVDTITTYALEIAKGLEYLHNNQIVHRNLNISQIFVIMDSKQKPPQIVLSPFFLAKEDTLWRVPDKNFDFYDNREFISPETRAEDISRSATIFSDVWSFGIILYQLLTLQAPYGDKKMTEEQKEEQMKAAPDLPLVFQSERTRKRAAQAGELTNDIDIEPYHSLIDLFRVCTNLEPTHRPGTSEIVKSLSNGINIKEMCGLSLIRGPGSLKDWTDTGHHTIVPLPDTQNSPLIIPTPSFVIEEPCSFGTPNPCYIQYVDKSIPYYAKNLALLPHENYLGTTASGDIALASVEVDGQFLSDTWNYKVLIRTKEEDLRILVTTENAKDRLKAFKQHPSLIDYNWQQIKDPSVKDLLIDFERKHLETKNYKFGVIYRKCDQVSDDDMLSNEHGSEEFNDFLAFLGEKITLKGWTNFRGGLDNASDTTGTEAIYTNFGEFEIMYHTSTLLPFDKGNPQQLHRKRHIGNDVIVIIFQDQDAGPFTPCEFASHFNHVFIVVQVHKPNPSDGGSNLDLIPAKDSHKSSKRQRSPRGAKSAPALSKLNGKQPKVKEKVFYKISLIFKDSVHERARPFLQDPCLISDDEESREAFLTKLINCERVAMRSEQFEKRLLNVRGQLLNHLNGEIAAKEADFKNKRGTLWFG